MHWAYYWRNVVRHHRVLIEGWLEGLPFKNLSEFSSSIADLEDLLRKWRTGKIYWRKLSEEEFNKMEEQRDAEIETGNIKEPTRRHRSDRGKKRPRRGEVLDGPQTQRPSKKYRSQSTVDSDSDEDHPGTTNEGTTPGADGNMAASTTASSLPLETVT